MKVGLPTLGRAGPAVLVAYALVHAMLHACIWFGGHGAYAAFVVPVARGPWPTALALLTAAVTSRACILQWKSLSPRERLGWGVTAALVAAHVAHTRGMRAWQGLTAEHIPTLLAAHWSTAPAGIPWFAIASAIWLGLVSWCIVRLTRVAIGALSTVAGLVIFALGACTIVAFATGLRVTTYGENEAPVCGPRTSAPPFERPARAK